MIAPSCKHNQVKRFGRDRNGNQRHRCVLCGKTWTENRVQPIGEMRIDEAKAIQVLEMLLEGVSIRSTVRLTHVAKGTILSLLEVVGRRALTYWQTKMQSLPAASIQCDEIWGFVGCKEKTRKRLHLGEEFGDTYTYTAIERDSKLLLAWHQGRRSDWDTVIFTDKVRRAVVGRCQVTTDGYVHYELAVPQSFNGDVDFAQLIKVYSTQGGAVGRYSPPEIIDIHSKVICGNPFAPDICTSHVERANLSIRMGIRRMTRLTNGFSKKWDNHQYAMAIFFLYYNFCRPHMTLSKATDDHKGKPTTPAMAAGLANHVWKLAELLNELATHC
jgi:transposase-like protein/IS1 family transposase